MRRRGEKTGCCELAVIAFVLFLGLQFAVLGMRVFGETAVLATTLVKWLALGIAGAAGLAALTAAAFGLGYALKFLTKGFFGLVSPPQARPARTASYSRQAREWQRGIAATIKRLRKRNWIEKDDAKRYRESADAAVERIVSLERDLKTLRSVPAAEELAREVEAVARNLVSRLERTHRALARLLAESALKHAPAVEINLRDAADELESLVAALEDVDAGSTPQAVKAARVAAASADEPPQRAQDQVNEELME